MLNEEFSAMIRSRRIEKGMTQKELADKLHVSESAISKWERGYHLPDNAVIEDLFQCLDIPLPMITEEKESAGYSDDAHWFKQRIVRLRAILFSASKEIGEWNRSGVNDIKLYIAVTKLKKGRAFQLARRAYGSEVYACDPLQEKEFQDYVMRRWGAVLVWQNGSTRMYRNETHNFDIKVIRHQRLSFVEYEIQCGGWFGADPDEI